jgi:hypothetical protein
MILALLQRRSERHTAVLATLAFWALSYALFTVRAVLIVPDAAIPSGIRLAATAAGAAIVFVFMVKGEHLFGSRRDIARTLAATLTAAAAVLAVRMLYTALAGPATRPWEENIRWVIVWAGYCGMTLALISVSRSNPGYWLERLTRTTVSPTRTIGMSDRGLALEWLIEALAEEIHAAPDGIGDQTVRRLAHRAGYLIADEDMPGAAEHNARVQIVARLAARYTTLSRRLG